MALEHTQVRQVRSVAKADVGDLCARWHDHRDESARDELLRRFLPLARRFARRYQGAHEPLDDLVQVASMALVKAIDRFDPNRGIAFKSFAVPTIAGELKRYFRDLGWSAHVPRDAHDRALKLEHAQRELTARNGRAPTVDELAVYLELSIDEVVDGLEASAAHHAKSLDAPCDDVEHDAMVDTLGGRDPGYEFVDFSASVAGLIKDLRPRDRDILRMRLIEDRTQTEIAEEIGISQMQVSRITRRLLARIRASVDGKPEPVPPSD